jgi:predicted AAA+ superfamily ATPase
MAKDRYKPRVIDQLLNRKLRGKGAVLIEGAKWCGKTSTAEQQAKSIIYMSDPKRRDQYQLFVDTNPEMILNGDTPRLIDEWQETPKLWDLIRFEVDHREGLGHFILTGSAVPAKRDDEILHSGTGRFAWLIMRPMSLWESGDSNGSVSLRELFDSPKSIAATCDLDLKRIAFLTCRGGWPQASLMGDDKDIALDQAIDYYDAVVNSDIQRVDGVVRDPERVKRLMRSYARYQGSQSSFAEIGKDMTANEQGALDENTISSYLNALRKIFVVEDMRAWNPNLRSKTAIRTTDTRYFVDPSIATAALGLGPDDLMHDLETFGLIFETLCVRDLRVFAQALDGEVYHYRDKTGLECDAVVHLRNGSYGLIEIKLGGDKLIEEGSKTLNALASKIDTTKMKNPSFLMILTAVGDFAYRRQDGVYVVPIGCLKD